MTARGTDWSLALLVSVLFVTGALELAGGARGDAWLFVVHGTAGGALALVLIWKLRRVWPRIVHPAQWDGRTVFGLCALSLVVTVLAFGWIWSDAGPSYLGPFSLLAWHEWIGAVVVVAVLLHAGARAKRLRARDVTQRRAFLHAAGISLAAVGAWQLQRPALGLLGLRGARRRFTGSYEASSFEGNAFPTTSWVSDRPRELAGGSYRLAVEGRVANPLELRVAELDAGDTLVATLDCTGGFYSTQRWRGIRLDRLIARAEPLREARHVRVISHTGYRWSFSLARAGELLLATHVGDEALSHEHGAPIRLVVPGRRGFEWVKWVTRVELHAGEDHGALASTIWSSFTPSGRGRA